MFCCFLSFLSRRSLFLLHLKKLKNRNILTITQPILPLLTVLPFQMKHMAGTCNNQGSGGEGCSPWSQDLHCNNAALHWTGEGAWIISFNPLLRTCQALPCPPTPIIMSCIFSPIKEVSFLISHEILKSCPYHYYEKLYGDISKSPRFPL
jgi:hypothetical protein